MNKAAPPEETAAPAGRRPLWTILASMRFALAVVAILVFACIAGTVIPQGDDLARFLQEHPERARSLGVLQALGLTRVFQAPWFIGLLGLLALSLISCGASQLLALFRNRAARKGRAFSSLLIHASLVAVLAGGLVRGVAGQKGSIPLHEGERVSAFDSPSGSVLFPFEVRLLAFAIETDPAGPVPAQLPVGEGECLHLHWAHNGPAVILPATVGVDQPVAPPGEPGGEPYTVKVLRAIPDFMMDPVTRRVETRSAQPRNPAIQVAVTGRGYASTNWLFAKYPEMSMPMRQSADAPFKIVYQHPGRRAPAGPVRNYRSTLEITEKGRVVKTTSLAVNSPLSHRGYTFYQSGYDPNDPSWTSLQVVRDPGVPLVFLGFAGLLAGIFLGLYVWPRGATGPEKD